MTTDELKAALREFDALMGLPRKDRKDSALALCLAKLVAAADDDALAVPAEAFAELSEDNRRVALAGPALVVRMALAP